MQTLDFDKNTLLRLAERKAPHAISIFMPTHQRGKEVNEGQDRIAFKNHVQAVRLELEAQDVPVRDLDALLEPMEGLLADPSFWRHQQAGLAVFRSANLFEVFHSPLPLPDTYRLADRFWLRPLLVFAQPARPYYLLSLGKDQATLYRADAYSIEAARTHDLVPAGLEAVTQYYDFEEELQGRTAGRGGTSAMYTSDDSNESQKEKDHLLADYFRLVDQEITAQIGTRNVPLLLASVAYFQPIYKQVNTYPHLHETGLTGNFDHVQPTEMHLMANELLTDYFGAHRQRRIDHYRNSSGGDLVSHDLRHLLEAAVTGRIDVLFLHPDAEAWGHFDETTLTATIHDEPKADDESLIDQLALLTLRNGGEVYVLDTAELLDGTAAPLATALYRF